MKFTAKVQERRKYGRAGATPWVQKFVFIPSYSGFAKGEIVEVCMKKPEKKGGGRG
jgi:hypothetical protein